MEGSEGALNLWPSSWEVGLLGRCMLFTERTGTTIDLGEV